VEILLAKSPEGFLYPVDESETEKLNRFKAGRAIRVDITLAQNAGFHRRTLKLFRFCYETFMERNPEWLEHKGKVVRPSFDRFRKDLVILAGHYHQVFDAEGNFHLVADSLSYEQCDQERAERIYSDCINAALKHVYQNTRSEEWLRETVDQLLSFS
jgi:hypothetical protein